MRIPVQIVRDEPKPHTVDQADPPTPAEAGQIVQMPVRGQTVEPEAAAVDQNGPDYRDLYLRAMAEMASFRRRTEQQAREQVEEERRRLLREFLESSDNLDRALAHLDEPGLRQGLGLTREGLRRFLEREGVETVPAAGQWFDPQLHEAIAVVDDGLEPGRVAQVIREGYRYGGRLLRPARVVVSR